MSLKEQGATEAEIERKVAKFEEKDEDDQFDVIAGYRQQKKAAFDKELSDYTPQYKPEENPVDPWEQIDPLYQAAAKKYEGKEIDGILMTPERIAEVSSFYQNNSLFKIKDGNIDPDDLFEKTAAIMYREVALDAAYEAGALDTEERLKEEYNIGKTPPSANGSHNPAPKQASTEVKKQMENLRASFK